MSPKDAIDRIVRARLEDSFGKAVALMIMASASNAADVPVFEPSASEYRRLIEAVCKDQRVVDMWGRATVDVALIEWQAAVA